MIYKLLLGVVFCFSFLISAETKKAPADTFVVEFNEVAIGPAVLDLIQRTKSQCLSKKCSQILVKINTPGGNLQTTRLIVNEILESPVPFLCLIAPQGGRAGSAGAIIMQACHLSGALETTNIGAATPINADGKDINKDLKSKIVNDTKSWVKGLAELRGRNIDFAEKIVTEAKAVTAKEAVELKAVDILAKNFDDFVTQANAREVTLKDEKKVKVNILSTFNVENDLRFQVMNLVMDPQVAYMMFMGSIGLIYFEITHPGLIVPGVVGGVGLILSMVSLHKMDVTTGGLLLMLLGVIFMVAEAFVASFGVLGIGGVISFFFGSMFLFDDNFNQAQLPMSTIVITTVLLGLAMFGIAYLAMSTRGVRRQGEFDNLYGKEAVVVKLKNSGKSGLVEVNGETWKFKCSESVELDETVIVEKHKGLTLMVTKEK